MAVSTEASQEASLEGMLHRVQAKWDGIEFVVKPFRDLKDTWLLAGVEDVQAVLEDSLVMMGTIAASRFVAGELRLASLGGHAAVTVLGYSYNSPLCLREMSGMRGTWPACSLHA